MTIFEALDELGYVYDCIWNNRIIYSLGKKSSKYSVFEHFGEIGIANPFEKKPSLIYCDLSYEQIKKYTELAKTLQDIEENPKNYSLHDFQEAKENIEKFIKEID